MGPLFDTYGDQPPPADAAHVALAAAHVYTLGGVAARDKDGAAGDGFDKRGCAGGEQEAAGAGVGPEEQEQ